MSRKSRWPAMTAVAGRLATVTPDDESAYWFPPLGDGDQLVVGAPTATRGEGRTAPGAVEGRECGNSAHNRDLPSHYPPGSRLDIRHRVPSRWHGRDRRRRHPVRPAGCDQCKPHPGAALGPDCRSPR